MPLICVLAAGMLLCSCEQSESSSAAQTSKVTSVTTGQQSSPVEIRTYEFPDFMNGEDTSDMLSNVISGGFDPAAVSKAVAEGPKKGFDYDAELFGEYYVFRDEGFIGIMNSDGNVVLKADKYTSAEPLSGELVRLGTGKEDEQRIILLRSGFGRFIDEGFNASEIVIKELPAEDEQSAPHYTLAVLGKNISASYDSLEPISRGELSTSRVYTAAYKASSGGRYYYLVFDEYYNMTVCEAAYAQIRLKVAGTYGECYILDGDDYSELSKMIKSFGREQEAVKPSKDENLDYIQIVFGICAGDRLTVTVSADGLCLTDGLTSKGQPINKYFSAYPKETFADLVGWVGEVAAGEYEKTR